MAPAPPEPSAPIYPAIAFPFLSKLIAPVSSYSISLMDKPSTAAKIHVYGTLDMTSIKSHGHKYSRAIYFLLIYSLGPK